MILERNETRLERNKTRLERNDTRLARNDTRLARNKTRSGNLHLSGTVLHTISFFKILFVSTLVPSMPILGKRYVAFLKSAMLSISCEFVLLNSWPKFVCLMMWSAMKMSMVNIAHNGLILIALA